MVMLDPEKQHRGGMQPFHVRKVPPQQNVKLESLRKRIAEACLECEVGTQSSHDSEISEHALLKREEPLEAERAEKQSPKRIRATSGQDRGEVVPSLVRALLKG